MSELRAAAAMMDLGRLDIAVLIPCFNEEATIGDVVAGFRAALPLARIYVYDNNSTDDTAAAAVAAGAFVRREPRQGKGNVIRRMFADIDAEIFVLADGDATYHAPSAPRLVRALIADDLDMVIGARTSEERAAYRFGHRFGNRVLTGIVGMLFGARLIDMLSGYRVFSRRFVKSFPALSRGFETETELTVHALELRLPYVETATPYMARPKGSASKLNSVADGVRILWTIGRLLRLERPVLFFGAAALLLAALAIGLAAPLLPEYLATGLVPRLPTVVLATGIMIVAVLSAFAGLILETVTNGRRELKRLAYLAAARWPDIRRNAQSRRATSSGATGRLRRARLARPQRSSPHAH